jgi:hypothetical protein
LEGSIGGYIEPVLGFGEVGVTGTAVIFGVRATDTRHPSGACAARVSRVHGQVVSAPCRGAGAARARGQVQERSRALTRARARGASGSVREKQRWRWEEGEKGTGAPLTSGPGVSATQGKG